MTTAAQGVDVETIRIGMLKDGAYEIVTMPLEAYVARVLAGEALPGSEPAALEALAIAVRTYTIANRTRHKADGFDLCDQTHCQVLRTATPVTERAAHVTAGRLLLYKGAPASIYYSASCGGHTEKPSNVWPGAENPPYLPSRADDGCGGVPQWSAELSTADLQRAFSAFGFRGRLRSIQVATRNESGRVQTLALEGLTPDRITGQDLRSAVGRTLGWQRVLSTDFELKRSGPAYRFSGRGSGHGVGMCVIGSTKLALRGRSAEEILEQYFPGAEISAVAAPPVPAPPVATDVILSLPEGDEGERATLTSLVRTERDALASALGVERPSRVSLRFHPTTDAYERIARVPWFTLSALEANELQFVPLGLLRQRGMVERAVRRALVHALADPALSRALAWVREGAALYFAEPVPDAARSSARVECPRDVELLQPTSIGALSEAYSRARACFAREIESGRAWRDVR